MLGKLATDYDFVKHDQLYKIKLDTVPTEKNVFVYLIHLRALRVMSSMSRSNKSTAFLRKRNVVQFFLNVNIHCTMKNIVEPAFLVLFAIFTI